MLNNFFICPVCKSGEYIRSGKQSNFIKCNSNLEEFWIPHFVCQFGAEDERYEGIAFGKYQIFFFKNVVHVYDLPRGLSGPTYIIKECEVKYEDINSAEKLECFVNNYRML